MSTEPQARSAALATQQLEQLWADHLADTVNISAPSSSIVRGETLYDTARNLQAMAPDVILIRHSSAGVPHQLARVCGA